MAIRDIFKISRKTFLNPSGWIDADSLRFQNQTIWTILKGLFTPDKPERTETFEEAMKRMGVNESDIRQTTKAHHRNAWLFLSLGLLVFIYSFYLLFAYGYFLAWLLGLSVSALLLGYAFQYSFWAFQMQRRKLGATFDEWKDAILGVKGTHE